MSRSQDYHARHSNEGVRQDTSPLQRPGGMSIAALVNGGLANGHAQSHLSTQHLFAGASVNRMQREHVDRISIVERSYEDTALVNTQHSRSSERTTDCRGPPLVQISDWIGRRKGSGVPHDGQLGGSRTHDQSHNGEAAARVHPHGALQWTTKPPTATGATSQSRSSAQGGFQGSRVGVEPRQSHVKTRDDLRDEAQLSQVGLKGGGSHSRPHGVANESSESDESEVVVVHKKKRAGKSKDANKMPSVGWHDGAADSLTDKMLDRLGADEFLRATLFPQSDDKSNGKTKVSGHRKLAKYLFKKHTLYKSWYDKDPLHFAEVVRMKLVRLLLRYKEVKEEFNKSGAGLTEEDYAEGSTNLLEKQSKKFCYYAKMDEIIGERGNVGTATINSLDGPNLSASRLGGTEKGGGEDDQRARNIQSVRTSSKKARRKEPSKGNDSEGSTDSSSEDSSISSDSTTSESESDKSILEKAKNISKKKKKRMKSKVDMRKTSNQSTRLDGLSTSIRKSARLNTKRKATRDSEAADLQRGPQRLAERRISILERQAEAQERLAAETAQHEHENAQREHEWKMKMAEIEAEKLKLEVLRLEMERARGGKS